MSATSPFGSGSAPVECLDRKDPEWDYGDYAQRRHRGVTEYPGMADRMSLEQPTGCPGISTKLHIDQNEKPADDFCGDTRGKGLGPEYRLPQKRANS